MRDRLNISRKKKGGSSLRGTLPFLEKQLRTVSLVMVSPGKDSFTLYRKRQGEMRPLRGLFLGKLCVTPAGLSAYLKRKQKGKLTRITKRCIFVARPLARNPILFGARSYPHPAQAARPQREFRPLRRATRALPWTCHPLRKGWTETAPPAGGSFWRWVSRHSLRFRTR